MKLYLSSEGFFEEAVQKARSDLGIGMSPHVETYLVKLLNHYLDTHNLFEKEQVDETGKRKPHTLAEMYMTAQLEQNPHKHDLLRKMADKSLYVSGFFADSLNRKVIDVEYYVEMGCTAYGLLAEHTRVDIQASIYKTFSQRFIDFVEVLNHISQNSMTQSNQGLLSLYDRYLKTGSEVAREKLIEMGIVTVPRDQAKLAKPS